jgi:uncharacterized membrane protein (UPF0182 family)
MMYNDKVGYGPTVGDALTEIFGPGAAATATGPAPTDVPGAKPPASPPAAQTPATPPQQGQAPEVPVPVGAIPGGGVQLSTAKAAALQDVNTALDAVQQAQHTGNFSDYGAALQRLDDAMNKYREAK